MSEFFSGEQKVPKNYYYNEKGVESETLDNDFLAKKTVLGKEEQYFVTLRSNELYNPLSTHANRNSKFLTKLKKVDKQTFNYYIKFLETKNLKYFNLTNRGLINV